MGKAGSDFPLEDFYRDIYPTYDRVNRIFTFGRDRHWRKLAAQVCLSSSPASVLDLCTGTGDFVFELARQAVGGVVLTGYDFSNEMLSEARIKQQRLGEREKPVEFVQGDVAHMPFADGQFDSVGITFGLRNLVYENSQAGRHLSEIYRVLRKGGQFVILESSRPSNAVWRFFNTLYLRMVLPYLGGLISGNVPAYRYLATSSRNYYSIREMSRVLEDAAFAIVFTKALFLGSVMLLVAVKK